MPILGVIASSIAKIGSFESIATATGTGSSGTITFSSIPSGFKHLQIRGISKNSGSVYNYAIVRLNGDSNAANYTAHQLYGNGTTASAYGTGTGALDGAYMFYTINETVSSSILGVGVCDILDFNSSTKYKTLRSLSGYDANGTGNIFLTSSLWLNTSPITSVTIYAQGATNFPTTTQFALYGIKEA